MKVTPDTLTDEQIRAERDRATTKRMRDDCRRAMHVVERIGSDRARTAARQRICDAINARTGAKP